MHIKMFLNTKPLLGKLAKVQDQLDRNLTTASYKGAQYVQAQAKLNISGGSRSGRLYRRRSIIHRASAPYEYPKSDTGRLVSSISVEKGNKYAVVGTNLKYGPYLENGTSRMLPRPWLSRTFNDNFGKISIIYNDALRASFRV